MLNKIVIVAKAPEGDGLTVVATVPYDGKIAVGRKSLVVGESQERRSLLDTDISAASGKKTAGSALRQAGWDWPTTND